MWPMPFLLFPSLCWLGCTGWQERGLTRSSILNLLHYLVFCWPKPPKVLSTPPVLFLTHLPALSQSSARLQLPHTHPYIQWGPSESGVGAD
ncbi:hypothetical protein LZ31DRAFT_555981 [Colletotrichum somersetense]|nr:hypothetical protein LZ31DRAFT_555981 [Colletotrichum somersetense]